MWWCPRDQEPERLLHRCWRAEHNRHRHRRHVRYIGVDGGGSPVDKSVTLAGVTNVAFHSIYSSSDIPAGFVGYARVSAGQPVAACSSVVSRPRPSAASTRRPMAPRARADRPGRDRLARAVDLPPLRGRSGLIGYNSWIQVQVADGSTANVSLHFVGDPNSGARPVRTTPRTR